MIFFFFSLLASLFGGITAGGFSGSFYRVQLAVDNPFAGIISFWPFIVALVLLLLAILWFQTIKGMRRRKATPSARQRTGIPSTVFLGVVTVLVLVLLAAPWYLESFSDRFNENATETAAEDRVETVLTVHGMDCTGCESLINKRVSNLDGIESVAASHTMEEVVVVYDKSKVSITLIAQTIEDSGYTVVLE